MFEDPSDRDAQEDEELQLVREAMAAFRAMPLRRITSLERHDTIACLECGHRRALLVWLLVGEHMRCRDCFEAGMRKAQEMIEQLG